MDVTSTKGYLALRRSALKPLTGFEIYQHKLQIVGLDWSGGRINLESSFFHPTRSHECSLRLRSKYFSKCNRFITVPREERAARCTFNGCKIAMESLQIHVAVHDMEAKAALMWHAALNAKSSVVVSNAIICQADDFKKARCVFLPAWMKRVALRLL